MLGIGGGLQWDGAVGEVSRMTCGSSLSCSIAFGELGRERKTSHVEEKES